MSKPKTSLGKYVTDYVTDYAQPMVEQTGNAWTHWSLKESLCERLYQAWKKEQDKQTWMDEDYDPDIHTRH